MGLSLYIRNNLKNKFFQIIILILIVSLVRNPAQGIESARNGLNLWFNILLPTLLPFFILSELFIASGLVSYFGRLLGPIMKPVFGISGEGAFPLIMSFVSGYPVGAKLSSRLRSLKLISRAEGDRLVTLASTSGPLYILGAVSIGMLSINYLNGLFLIPHYLGAITVGLIFSLLIRDKSTNGKIKQPPSLVLPEAKNKSLPIIIADSVKDGINSILLIGGFVIIYNVIIDILLNSPVFKAVIVLLSKTLKQDPRLIEGIFAGFIELTTGCSKIAALDIELIYRILAINFILGWGGLSIISQAISFISQTDINIKLYLISKFLHAIIASLYTYILYILHYKDIIIPSSIGGKIRQGVFSFKYWLKNIYFSSKMAMLICIFFIILSLLTYNISLAKIKK